MTREEEGFARRWARRKRESRQEVTSPAEPPVEEPPPAESIDLAEIAGWLRRNVPDAWKTAALRRLWVADPAIRDFVEMADYAHDWNVPGGAPGFGPMRAADNVADLLRRVIGAVESEVAQSDAAEPVGGWRHDGLPAGSEQMPGAPRTLPPRGETEGIATSPIGGADRSEESRPSPAEPVRRRGGRATPA